MKYIPQKLYENKGCMYCLKKCIHNGAASVEDGGKPKNADLYGCNSSKDKTTRW